MNDETSQNNNSDDLPRNIFANEINVNCLSYLQTKQRRIDHRRNKSEPLIRANSDEHDENNSLTNLQSSSTSTTSNESAISHSSSQYPNVKSPTQKLKSSTKKKKSWLYVSEHFFASVNRFFFFVLLLFSTSISISSMRNLQDECHVFSRGITQRESMDILKAFFLRNNQKKKIEQKSPRRRRFSFPIDTSLKQSSTIRRTKSLPLFQVNPISTNINPTNSSSNSNQTIAFLTALSLFIQRVFLPFLIRYSIKSFD